MIKKLSQQIALIFLIIATFFCLAFSLSACGNGDSTDSGHIHTYNTDNVCTECGYTLNYTEGLSYYKYKDEYIYLGGKTTDSTKVTLAAYYNGLPVTTVMIVGSNRLASWVQPKLATGEFTEADFNELAEIHNEILDYSDITELTVPDGVTTVEIRKYETIKTVNLPQTVTSLEVEHCENLTNVNTPSSLSYIYIYDCPNIKTETQNGITYIDTCVIDCNDIATAEIREGTTAIRNYAFAYCEPLTAVTIPESVTYIGNSAFYNCSLLSSIVIPNNVTYIGNGAFAFCEALISVTFENTNGWYITETSETANGTEIDVTDASQNATYFTDTYINHNWYKN